MAPNLRRWAPIAIAAAIVITAGLVLAATRGDEGAAWEAVHIPWLVAALFLHIAAHVFWGARVALLGGFGPLQGWSLITGGVFGGAITPGRVGGEAVKLAVLVKRGRTASDAGRILLADRAMDLVFFLGLGFLAAWFVPRWLGPETRVWALAGTFVLLAFLSLIIALLWAPAMFGTGQRRDRLATFITDVRGGLFATVRQPPLLAGALFLTLLNWVVEYGALWAVLRAFDVQLPFVQVFLIGAVLTLASNIPITPGGVGVAELGALALFTPLVPDLSLLVPVAWRLVTYDYDLAVGGITAARQLGFKASPIAPTPP